MLMIKVSSLNIYIVLHFCLLYSSGQTPHLVNTTLYQELYQVEFGARIFISHKLKKED